MLLQNVSLEMLSEYEIGVNRKTGEHVIDAANIKLEAYLRTFNAVARY